MYNFDPYNVLLTIATNISVLLMTAFVLQGHIYVYINHSNVLNKAHSDKRVKVSQRVNVQRVCCVSIRFLHTD